jgi:large subunit ribosomal protein L18e
MKRTGPTNTSMQSLIAALKEVAYAQDVALWKRIASDLEKPTRSRRVVNIYKLDKHSKEGETIIVPGKLLGTGDLGHKVNVAAFVCSKQAAEKVTQAGGSVMTLNDLVRENPKGKNVRILG